MLFVDEVNLADEFTARALLLLDGFMKGLEPRLVIAQTRFPTAQYVLLIVVACNRALVSLSLE